MLKLTKILSSMRYCFFTAGLRPIVVVLFAALPLFGHTADNKQSEDSSYYQTLNHYHTTTHRILHDLAATLPARDKDLPDITALAARVYALSNNQNTTLASLIIYANEHLLFENIESIETENILWFLYENNFPTLANTLRQYANEQASENTIARLNYQYAKYTYSFSYWNDVIKTIQDIDVSVELNQDEAQYSYFMMGVALQNIQQHRDALKVFDAISENAQYYVEATLNKAISNLRQDWWTDAHIEINKLIARDDVKNNHTLLDRLYLTLGYSQLQFEFYRDSRDSFRSVGIDSPYTNQALLGIGLSAMHQKDFISALNAFLLLNTKNTIDATVEESYILTPFVQEKLQQKQLAAAKYSEAIAYFQHAESSVTRSIKQLDQSSITEFKLFNEDDQKSLIKTTLEQTSLYMTPRDLRMALRNVQQLIEYSNPQISIQPLIAIRESLSKALKDLCRQELEQHREIYKSYLSQARFALAKLYDKE